MSDTIQSRTRHYYAGLDLDVVFANHGVIADWKNRGEDYESKLLTLGFHSLKRPIPLARFVNLIGAPDLSLVIAGHGTVCYVTSNEEFHGWCWIFDVQGSAVNGFGTNGYNQRFVQAQDGRACFIYELCQQGIRDLAGRADNLRQP